MFQTIFLNNCNVKHISELCADVDGSDTVALLLVEKLWKLSRFKNVKTLVVNKKIYSLSE